jgi:hypothetical protein
MMRCYWGLCPGWDTDIACKHDPWRKLTPADLKLPPDTPVRINGTVKGSIGSHAGLMLPGNCPFLLGMQFIWDIEVPDERFAKVES